VPLVVTLIGLSTAYYFVDGPFETASPSFVRTRLDSGEGVYSLLWALFGGGALATVPLGSWLARRTRCYTSLFHGSGTDDGY
jgi:hypothetical protein